MYCSCMQILCLHISIFLAIYIAAVSLALSILLAAALIVSHRRLNKGQSQMRQELTGKYLGYSDKGTFLLRA